MILVIPTDVEVIETRSSTIWFDKSGILYSITKHRGEVAQTVEEIQKEMEELRKILAGKKFA